ncbi:MAG: DUF6429 family protein [Desulfobacterales bacterium]
MTGGEKNKFEYDKDKVDELALALLHLTSFEGELGLRAWKSIDLGVLTRLYEKGFISNPITGSKSVAISREAAEQSEMLFRKYFAIKKEEKKLS